MIALLVFGGLVWVVCRALDVLAQRRGPAVVFAVAVAVVAAVWALGAR